jgi:arabinofuranosyltransferase
MRRLGTIVFVVLVAALAVSALAHVAWYFPRTVDDMFIYLRFAENFASGHGLVYNPGERVEGFSSLPWVLLQSLAFLTGLDAVTFTKVLGILSLGALLYAAALIVLDMTGSRVLAVLCALLLSLNGYLVFWAVTGLETPLFLAALLWTVVASTRYEQAPGFRRGAGFVLAAFFLSVARPEGPLYVAAIVAAAALSRGGGLRPSEKLKYVAAIALAAGTLYLLVVIARFLYYGEIVPHTYYAKATAAPSLLHLSPLVTQGATVAEAVFILLGLFLTVMLSLTRGSGALAPLRRPRR